MNQASQTSHVVFGRSIAETLRDALPLLGSADRVIALPGLLSIGPIDPPDPALRRAWARSVLRIDSAEWHEIDGLSASDPAWAEAVAPDIAPVFWACLINPMEHACFLAFAARMQDRPFDIVDATDLDVTTLDGVQRPGSLGSMRVQDIVAANLDATRRPLSAEERRVAANTWSQLRRENAPFRIVSDRRLVSAPLTYYDDFLVEQASRQWEIAAQLIARVHTALHFGTARRGQGNGADILFARMLALGDAGALEITGPGPDMRNHQVRKP